MTTFLVVHVTAVIMRWPYISVLIEGMTILIVLFYRMHQRKAPLGSWREGRYMNYYRYQYHYQYLYCSGKTPNHSSDVLHSEKFIKNQHGTSLIFAFYSVLCRPNCAATVLPPVQWSVHLCIHLSAVHPPVIDLFRQVYCLGLLDSMSLLRGFYVSGSVSVQIRIQSLCAELCGTW